MPPAVPILAVLLGIAVVLWTCEACRREAAEQRADRLERTAAIRKRWLGALRDLVG